MKWTLDMLVSIVIWIVSYFLLFLFLFSFTVNLVFQGLTLSFYALVHITFFPLCL